MIAFAVSLLFALAGMPRCILYSKRRPVGTPLSWGEAMAAASSSSSLHLVYGVVPHQWLTLADNELGWRADRILFGPGDIFEPNRFLPFTITYEALRDIVVTVIYGVALAGPRLPLGRSGRTVAKPKTEVVPTTSYGRPLARKS